MKTVELIEQGRFLGEEFLLWLWMRGFTNGGTSGQDGDTSACFIHDEVVLVSEWGDVKELSLRKGNPQESREAFEALSRGMRPNKAKLHIISGDLEWAFMLGATQLDVAAMKLPPTQAKDLHGRLSDRMFLLEEGIAHLERRFALFLERRAKDSDSFKGDLVAWIKDGLVTSKNLQ
ncbi:MAG: hypothetical protein FWG02_02510 [Holophagaceae bacterium]|nr:hypothetical protein [Holophagaceae bacterium]